MSANRSEYIALQLLTPLAKKEPHWTDPAPHRPGRGKKPDGPVARALARFLVWALRLDV